MRKKLRCSGYDSANDYLYTANAGGNVTVIDGSTNTPLGGITVGPSPYDIVVDSTNGDVYVVNAGASGTNANTVSVIDPSSSGTGSPTISSFTVAPSTIALGHTTYYNVSVSGGTPPYTYSYINLPTGCTTQSVNSLPCAPTAKGTYATLVTVTDNLGNTVTSTAVVLTVGTGGSGGGLVSVGITVTPSNGTISPNGIATLTAVSSCTGGSCGAGVTYIWTLSGSSLGHLSSTTGQSVTFTAGNAKGSQTITVTATLGSLSKTGQTSLTIGYGSAPSSSSNGWLLWVAIIGVITAVVVVTVVVVMMKKKPRAPSMAVPPPAPGYTAPPPQYATAPPTQYGGPPPQYGTPPPPQP